MQKEITKYFKSMLLTLIFVGLFGGLPVFFSLFSSSYIGYQDFEVEKEILWNNNNTEMFKESNATKIKLKILFLYNGSFNSENFAITERIEKNKLQHILFNKKHSANNLFIRQDINGELTDNYIKLEAMKFEPFSNNLLTFVLDKSQIFDKNSIN